LAGGLNFIVFNATSDDDVPRDKIPRHGILTKELESIFEPLQLEGILHHVVQRSGWKGTVVAVNSQP